MSGRYDFEAKTATHLGIAPKEFHAWDKRAKDVFCRDYMKELLVQHNDAKGISAAIGITARNIYAIMDRYGVDVPKRQYNATKRALRKGVKQ